MIGTESREQATKTSQEVKVKMLWGERDRCSSDAGAAGGGICLSTLHG